LAQTATGSGEPACQVTSLTCCRDAVGAQIRASGEILGYVIPWGRPSKNRAT
jgi:hypothetical protein